MKVPAQLAQAHWLTIRPGATWLQVTLGHTRRVPGNITPQSKLVPGQLVKQLFASSMIWVAGGTVQHYTFKLRGTLGVWQDAACT